MIDVIALFVATLGVVLACIIGFGQLYFAKFMKNFEIKQYERDEKYQNDLNYAKVTEFIQKYSNGNSDVFLLPLCVAAYKYNPVYPYRRDIYREFCALPEFVQNDILRRENINLISSKTDDYYHKMLRKLETVIKLNAPDDMDIFYTDGQYFKRALEHHRLSKIPNLRCAVDDDERMHRESPFGKSIQIQESDMLYADHITNLLAWHMDEKPIEKLWNESTNMGSPKNGNELVTAYLCCMIAKYISCYSTDDNECNDMGFVEDYDGELYMEDLFLDALRTIENCNILLNDKEIKP